MADKSPEQVKQEKVQAASKLLTQYAGVLDSLSTQYKEAAELDKSVRGVTRQSITRAVDKLTVAAGTVKLADDKADERWTAALAQFATVKGSNGSSGQYTADAVLAKLGIKL